MIQTQTRTTVKEPRITLVGAGPGDAELITIKGIKALQTADVVLYDALVNEELLEFAPEHATKVYVGKRRLSRVSPVLSVYPAYRASLLLTAG